MTGYGRGLVCEDGREMTVEVKSVNHRFLDVSFRLARPIAFLDDAVRTGVAERLARGHVDVFVNYGTIARMRAAFMWTCSLRKPIGRRRAN